MFEYQQVQAMVVDPTFSDDEYIELPQDEGDVDMASSTVGAQGLSTLKPEHVQDLLRAARSRCIVKEIQRQAIWVDRASCEIASIWYRRCF